MRKRYNFYKDNLTYGTVIKCNNGDYCAVLKYHSSRSVSVVFLETGFVRFTQSNVLWVGSVKDNSKQHSKPSKVTKRDPDSPAGKLLKEWEFQRNNFLFNMKEKYGNDIPNGKVGQLLPDYSTTRTDPFSIEKKKPKRVSVLKAKQVLPTRWKTVFSVMCFVPTAVFAVMAILIIHNLGLQNYPLYALITVIPSVISFFVCRLFFDD